jgi:hypothetical protein
MDRLPYECRDRSTQGGTYQPESSRTRSFATPVDSHSRPGHISAAQPGVATHCTASVAGPAADRADTAECGLPTQAAGDAVLPVAAEHTGAEATTAAAAEDSHALELRTAAAVPGTESGTPS